MNTKCKLPIIIQFIWTIAFIGCKSQPTDSITNQYPPPPPLEFETDIVKWCGDLKSIKLDGEHDSTIYLIYDSIDLYNRAGLEYLLHKKYGLVPRGTFHTLDTTCLKPFYDSVIESKYRKTTTDLLTEATNELQLLQKQIGNGKIKSDIYYVADVYPSYPGKTRHLYQNVDSIKNSLDHKARKTGTVMFYFVIDTMGSIGGIEIYKHLDNETDSLSKLIMKSLPHKWTPAKSHNKKVNYWMQYAITWQ